MPDSNIPADGVGESAAAARGERFRPFQRLRGARAFQRPRSEGVFRYSDAALIRILVPWEAVAGQVESSDSVAKTANRTQNSRAAQPDGSQRHSAGEDAAEPVAGGSADTSASGAGGGDTLASGMAGVDALASNTGGDDRSPLAAVGANAAAQESSRKTFPQTRRLGVVASRKVGNAVLRNRAKRVFREIFRRNQALLPQGCDVMVIVKRGFAAAKREELEHLFADVARRAHRSLGK